MADDPSLDQPGDFAAPEPSAPLLPLLTLEEAQDAIEVLSYYGTADNWHGDTAARLARELAARVPSREQCARVG
ncbi:hypothetical protein ACWGNN_00810 [Streptomyces sp. NPDC055817]